MEIYEFEDEFGGPTVCTVWRWMRRFSVRFPVRPFWDMNFSELVLVWLFWVTTQNNQTRRHFVSINPVALVLIVKGNSLIRNQVFGVVCLTGNLKKGPLLRIMLTLIHCYYAMKMCERKVVFSILFIIFFQNYFTYLR